MSQSTLTELLKDYGNAEFDCGAFNLDDIDDAELRRLRAIEFQKLNLKAHSLRQQIIDLFNAIEQKA